MNKFWKWMLKKEYACIINPYAGDSDFCNKYNLMDSSHACVVPEKPMLLGYMEEYLLIGMGVGNEYIDIRFEQLQGFISQQEMKET